MINVSHLTKTYQSWKKQPGLLGSLKSLINRETLETTAVQDLSFSIEEGECVGFLGPNGAGKTTTLKMLSGILWPTSGEATVLGHTPWKREREFQRQFAIVLGQKNQLWWDLPARDTFELNKEIYAIPSHQFEARLQELSERLDVTHLLKTPVKQLSLGERMKCELINALLHRPRVLLLDEPTIGLDVVSQRAVRTFLKEWNQKEKTTILLTSHTMADVEALCERIILIDHGQLRYDGLLTELKDSVDNDKTITITLQHPITKKTAQTFGTLKTFDPLRISYAVSRDNVRTLTKTLLDHLPIADVSIEEPNLEDVIHQLFS
jgi:ABC-2 type transport system ATP-binding protein